MPRPRRTDVDDRVFPICNELFARGEEPQTRTIRALLVQHGHAIGQNLVQESLDRWRETEKPRAGAPGEPLAPELVRFLTDWIGRERLSARAELEATIATLRTEKEDLLAAAHQRDAELTALTTQGAELKAERDRLLGQTAQQAADLERLQSQLDLERHAAEAARVDLAQARLKAESHEKLVEELRNERASLRQVIDTEREGRINAERSLAGSDASLVALRQHFDQLMRLHDELETEGEQLQKRLDDERHARATAERGLAACQAEAKAILARAEDLASREQELRGELKRREDLIEQLRIAGVREKPESGRKGSES